MTRLPTILWLTALWVVLWRDVSFANVASGLLVGVLVEIAQPDPRPSAARHGVRPLALLSFIGWFALKLVEANLVVAREVVTPANSIRTGVIEVHLPRCSRAVFTMIANAISLTPGTVILEAEVAETPTAYVHVLHLHDVEQARRDIHDLARRALAAFPLRTDLAVDQGDAR